MLLGFNTNYRYRGVLFHVQTEDSGLDNPHVITHLFHGGNIMASRKGDYSGRLGSSDIEGDVRSLMETQHKGMLKELQGGEFDPILLKRIGPSAFPDLSESADTMSELKAVESISEPAAELISEAEPLAAEPTPAPSDAGAPGSAEERLNRAFGEGVVSQKPLDEVVLEYLVENARKRKRRNR